MRNIKAVAKETLWFHSTSILAWHCIDDDLANSIQIAIENVLSMYLRVNLWNTLHIGLAQIEISFWLKESQ